MPAGFESMIRVSIRADEIYQKQKQQKLQDHVGDLLEHGWHYDCVVSPKYNISTHDTTNGSSNTHTHLPFPLLNLPLAKKPFSNLNNIINSIIPCNITSGADHRQNHDGPSSASDKIKSVPGPTVGKPKPRPKPKPKPTTTTTTSSTSQSRLPATSSMSSLSKPLAITEYPSLSCHDSGYVSLAAFINSSCNSNSNSLCGNDVQIMDSSSTKVYDHHNLNLNLHASRTHHHRHHTIA